MDLIDRYTEHILPDLPASARDYARHLRWWKDQLGPLREPGPKGKRSNATVNRYLTTLNAVYTYGMSPAVSWVTQHVVRTVGERRSPGAGPASSSGPQTNWLQRRGGPPRATGEVRFDERRRSKQEMAEKMPPPVGWQSLDDLEHG